MTDAAAATNIDAHGGEGDKFGRITKKFLRDLCKKLDLYSTPYLNDVLYLHYKGFSKIENLEEYTGLKCLWLECNGIRKIENLDNQKELRCLYLHHNLIKKIENLDALFHLDTLVLSHNCISKLENLEHLTSLNTLNVSHNKLQTSVDIEILRMSKKLSVLDISFNQIDDKEAMNVFYEMENLRVLTLTGNPVVKMISPYRKIVTVSCKNLQYLDDRPIFEKDRLCAEAWHKQGPEAERRVREKYEAEEYEKLRQSTLGLTRLRESQLQNYSDVKDEMKSDGFFTEQSEAVSCASEDNNMNCVGDRDSSDSAAELDDAEDNTVLNQGIFDEEEKSSQANTHETSTLSSVSKEIIETKCTHRREKEIINTERPESPAVHVPHREMLEVANECSVNITNETLTYNGEEFEIRSSSDTLEVSDDVECYMSVRANRPLIVELTEGEGASQPASDTVGYFN
ncbi:dynein axonemal assembly factor 1-like [Schistocerca serialis cubense]|uniref:dynein axonemal assembly factor 1-like n=1 Tax=Schistocerca serialis cubense TaxID=2023355 RepID=UPI00214EE09E|nr:dynein axonemal assembly factor 1-like [Schistocerca serialis cubense]